MIDIYLFRDYRLFMKAVYEDRKRRNALYSYRAMALAIGIDSSQLYRIISKNLQMSLRYVESTISNLRLKGKEAQYFRILVSLGRAKTEKEKNLLIEKMLGMIDVKSKTLTKEQFLFFKEWYNPTVHCLLSAQKFTGDYRKLAKAIAPKVTPKEVQDSISLLMRLGLAVEDKVSGEIHPGNAHLSTKAEEVSMAIRNYQAEMLSRGKDALENFSKEERDFSTLTFAIDEECLKYVKEILTECRRQIQNRVQESKTPDRVMHLNLNLFPTAILTERKK